MFPNFWEFMFEGDDGCDISFLKTYFAQQCRFQSTFFFFKTNLTIVNIGESELDECEFLRERK